MGFLQSANKRVCYHLVKIISFFWSHSAHIIGNILYTIYVKRFPINNHQFIIVLPFFHLQMHIDGQLWNDWASGTRKEIETRIETTEIETDRNAARSTDDRDMLRVGSYLWFETKHTFRESVCSDLFSIIVSKQKRRRQRLFLSIKCRLSMKRRRLFSIKRQHFVRICFHNRFKTKTQKTTTTIFVDQMSIVDEKPTIFVDQMSAIIVEQKSTLF